MLRLPSLNALRPLLLALVLSASGPLGRAEPLISEFMAANSSALVGDVGDPSDWIEISNPDPTPSHSHFYHITTPAAP